MEKDENWLREQEELLAIELAKEPHMPQLTCSKCGGTGKVKKNTPFENNIYILLTVIFLILGISGTVSFAIPSLQPFAHVSSFMMTMIFLIFAINLTKGKY